MPSTITTSIWEEPRADTTSPPVLDVFEDRRKSTPAMPPAPLEVSTKAAAFRATMMAASSPPPTPRLVRPPRRDSLARRLRSNSGLSLHVNLAALRQYTDYNTDGTPITSEFAVEWGPADSLSDGLVDGPPGSRVSVASMPQLSWRQGNDGPDSHSPKLDLFGRDAVQMVLKSPEASERLLRFAGSGKSVEAMEFLLKLREYTHSVNSVISSLASISSTYTSVAATSSLRLPHQASRALNADIKHVATTMLPALETLFADARAHVEQRVARDLFPAFVRTQLAMATSAALANEVRHSPRCFDPRFPGLADAFCLADPLQFDCPVSFVSDGMAELAGYAPDEIIGRNCRFLQSRHVSAAAGGGNPAQQHPSHPSAARLRAAMQAASMAYPSAAPNADRSGGILEMVLNHRRDAEGVLQPFWNLLFVCPLTTANGRVAYFLGGQINVSDAVGSQKELLDILSSAGEPRPSSSSTGGGSSDAGGCISSQRIPMHSSRIDDSATTPRDDDEGSSAGEDMAVSSFRTGRYRHLQKKKKPSKKIKKKGNNKAESGSDKTGRDDGLMIANGDDQSQVDQQQQQDEERARRRSMPRGFSFKPFRRQASFEGSSSALPARAPSRTASRTPTPATATAARDYLSARSVSPSSPLANPWSPSPTSQFFHIHGSRNVGSPTFPPTPGTPRYSGLLAGEDGAAPAHAAPEFLGAYVRHMVLEYAAGESAAAPPQMKIEFCSPAALELLGLSAPFSPSSTDGYAAAIGRVLHRDILTVLADGAGASASITGSLTRHLLAAMAEGKSARTLITVGGSPSPDPENQEAHAASAAAVSAAPAAGAGGSGFHFSASRRRSTATAVAAGKKKPRRMPSILTGRGGELPDDTPALPAAPPTSSSARIGDVFDGLSTWKGLGGSGSASVSSSTQQQQQQKERDVICHWTPLRNAEGSVRWVVLILVPVTSLE